MPYERSRNISNPLVVIIIVCFNHRSYVQQSIESVYAQTYKRIEIIVIDNGSSDGSADFLSDLQKIWGFQLIKNPRMSLVKSVNMILEKMTGNYHCILAADDYFHCKKVEIQVRELELEPEVAICSSGLCVVDANGDQLRVNKIKRRFFSFNDFFLGRYYFPAPATMVRTSVFRAIGGFDENYLIEDHWLLMEITRRGYKALQLGIVLCSYRRHGSNISGNLEWMYDQNLINLRKYSTNSNFSLACSILNMNYFVEAARFHPRASIKYLSKVKTAHIFRMMPKFAKGILYLLLPSNLIGKFRSL